jgi:hypothetical protein
VRGEEDDMRREKRRRRFFSEEGIDCRSKSTQIFKGLEIGGTQNMIDGLSILKGLRESD